MMTYKTVQLYDSDMDAYALLAEAQAHLRQQHISAGAQSVFIGRMRDSNQGQSVSEMQMEHYPGMTEKQLERIAESAAKRWPLQQCMIRHRYGRIEPGDDIVVIATWSEHREAAIRSCEYIIEELKSRATFWKKEVLTDSGEARWVAASAQ